jgi:hypothetical protein
MTSTLHRQRFSLPALAIMLAILLASCGPASESPDSIGQDAGSSNLDADSGQVDAGANVPDAGSGGVDAGSSIADAGMPSGDAGPTSGNLIVEFDGTGPVENMAGVTTNNASALPDVTQTDGRYRAALTDNTDNITLHYNNDQGRLDAWLTRFPFEFIARNIGIGTVADSQTPPPFQANAYNFAGVQVHVASDLDSPNSAHVVVGHRAPTAFTIEGKNTSNGSSSVDDIGANSVPDGRADIRIVGDANGDLSVYWQTPNLGHTTQPDNWIPYDGGNSSNGQLPGTQADFGGNGSLVYVGLITYAFYDVGVPFVGTCDSIELIEN